MPAGLTVGIGVAALVLLFGSGGEGSILAPIGFALLFPTVLAWMIADRPRESDQFAQRFKRATMPRLLSGFGDLAYERSGLPPTVDALVKVGLLPEHDANNSISDDTISGSYRQQRVRIDELMLRGMRRVTNDDAELPRVFDGLVVEIEVEHPFTGTTLALPNLPLFDLRKPRANGMERLTLEDPAFNDAYAVFGSDQVAARAVLTPATMQQLLLMADSQMLMPPGFWAHGERLCLTFPHPAGKANFFDPPDLNTSNAEAQILGQIDDLTRVFDLIDSVLETQSLRFSHRPSDLSRQGMNDL